MAHNLLFFLAFSGLFSVFWLEEFHLDMPTDQMIKRSIGQMRIFPYLSSTLPSACIRINNAPKRNQNIIIPIYRGFPLFLRDFLSWGAERKLESSVLFSSLSSFSISRCVGSGVIPTMITISKTGIKSAKNSAELLAVIAQNLFANAGVNGAIKSAMITARLTRIGKRLRIWAHL